MVFDHWTAEINTVLVLLVWSVRSSRVRSGIENVVSNEFVNDPMEVIRSRAGHEIDIGSRTDRKLGVCDVRLDVKLLDRIRRRADGEGIGKESIVQHSVHCVVVLLRPLPVDRRAHRSSSKLHGERPLLAAFNQWNCPGRKQSKLVKLTAVQRQFDDRGVAHHFSRRRRGCIDLLNIGIDLNCLCGR